MSRRRKTKKKQLVETVYIDGVSREVRKTSRFSMRGLPVELQDAATRFARDYESAYRSLRSPVLGVAVDGGGRSDAIDAIDGQARIVALRKAVGDRVFTIAEAVVVHGCNIENFGKAAGANRNEAGTVVRDVLREIADFYSGQPRGDRWLAAAERIKAEAGR